MGFEMVARDLQIAGFTIKVTELLMIPSTRILGTVQLRYSFFQIRYCSRDIAMRIDRMS